MIIKISSREYCIRTTCRTFLTFADEQFMWFGEELDFYSQIMPKVKEVSKYLWK